MHSLNDLSADCACVDDKLTHALAEPSRFFEQHVNISFFSGFFLVQHILSNTCFPGSMFLVSKFPI